jgi:hypothetical protein
VAPPQSFEHWHIHVDAKTYGPYDLNQIAQMVERRQIIGSDMVRAHGGSGWVKAANDPILGALFRHQKHYTSEAEPPVRATGLRRHWAKILLGGIAIITLLWIAWPYYAAYSLFIAFRDGDVSVLEDRVAWDSVRQGLRGDMNAMFLEKLSADAKSNSSGGALGAGFAAMLGPAIINQLVDGYVTPQAIAAAKRAEASNISAKETDDARPALSKAVEEARRFRWNQVQYAFFSGPLTFKINFLPEHDPPLQNPVTLLFKWGGDWKLTRVLLPTDVFGRLPTAMRVQNDVGSLLKNGVLSKNPSAPDISKPTEPMPLREQLAQAKSALNDLRAEEEAAATSLAEQKAVLERIEITKPRFAYRETGFLKESSISFSIANNGTIPIKRIFVHGKLQTLGRAIPWVDADFNYEFPGGIEPKEKKDMSLAPNTFSDWGKVPREAVNGAVLTLTITAFEDAAGKRFGGDDATKDLGSNLRKKANEAEIRKLQDKINNLETQLKQGE